MRKVAGLILALILLVSMVSAYVATNMVSADLSTENGEKNDHVHDNSTQEHDHIEPDKLEKPSFTDAIVSFFSNLL
ncbi:MAG: hypothetical protein H8Z69_01010 [Nanohaloarchaea archaeon]|nr:hypothetical protein [Candidatus Nanohaloarchaea archaeon]